MRYLSLILVLFTWLGLAHPSALAQTAPATNSQAKDKDNKDKDNAKPSGPDVAPDAVVIKIEGLCSGDPSSPMPGAAPKTSGSSDSKATHPPDPKNPAANADCQTIVTRAQYEKLASVVAAKQQPPATIQFAHFYATQLVYAQKARELGLDKDPKFDEILKFTYLQVLGRFYNNHMQQEANAKADAEFDQYYKQHPEEYEQVQVLQISVPKKMLHPDQPEGAAPAPPKPDTPADEAALKAEAEKIRARAAAGEDFEKLEAEVYTFAGDPDSEPDTDMGDNTRAELAAAQWDKLIFAMQPGQVSEVIEAPEAWHIFKLVSKHMMPPEEGKKRMAMKLMKESMDSVHKSVDPQFNQSYFGAAAAEQAKSGGDEAK
jgi:PPIC-type PPIASE domain